MGITIDEVIESARTMFKNDSIVMKMTEKKIKKIAVQKTGLPQLDVALGVGGIPKGRIIEIYGPESSGKTTLALTIIAEAQKSSGSWAWYGDMEHALDPEWAMKLGVNMDKLLISQPDHGEQCLELTKHFIKTGVIDIVVVDSVASLVPMAELEGDMTSQHMGLQARLMSKALRKLTGVISKTECTAFFINQIRDKIGVKWGSPETTPGGKALKFYCSVRLDVRKVGDIGKKEESIGCTIKVNVKKNKVAPPFRICEASLLYDKGFDISTNLFEAGLMFGVIEKSGKTFTFQLDEEIITLGIGKNNAKDGVVALSKEVREKLYDLIVKKGIEKGSLVNLDDSDDSEDKVGELEKEIKGEKIELIAEE